MPALNSGPRLPAIAEHQMNLAQRTLVDSIRSGPRGVFKASGPFAVYLHAPAFGELAQKLGGHVRFNTSIPPRLSEFAILVVAHFWQAQYEWVAHEPIASKQGVKPETIRDLRAGREPKKAAKDERALYDFIKELFKTKRVSNRNYARVTAILGNEGTVELVGLVGYYSTVAMTLNVFRMPVPEGTPAPFKEKAK